MNHKDEIEEIMYNEEKDRLKELLKNHLTTKTETNFAGFITKLLILFDGEIIAEIE